VFCNYLQGKKTSLISGVFAAGHLQNSFSQNFSAWNQETIEEQIDFYKSIDSNPVP